MFWWLLLGVFIVLMLWLLFAPLKLSLSTLRNQYHLSFGWVVSVSAVFLADDIQITFNVFGIKKGTTALKLITRERRKKSKAKKTDKTKAKITGKLFQWEYITNFIRTFRIKKFFLNVDFGSVYYNAWLFPLGEIFQRNNVYCTTNFSGINTIDVEVVNRPSKILWSIIKTQINRKQS